MENIAQFIEQFGFSAVLLAWMIYKDYKFNENILAVLSEVKDVLVELRSHHTSEKVDAE